MIGSLYAMKYEHEKDMKDGKNTRQRAFPVRESVDTKGVVLLQPASVWVVTQE